MPPFVPFGPAHLGALVATGLTAAVVALAVRSTRPALNLGIRCALATMLIVAATVEIGRGAAEGWLTLESALPLHLCDAALVIAVIALLWPRRSLSEVLYFWALSGSLLAMASPDLAVGFPRWEAIVFFALHGLVVVSAALLSVGMRLAPRRGSSLRVFALTNAYAAAVGLVNFVWGTNYLYLRAKPPNATLLDLFGPWPVYILVADVLALVLFLALEAPWRLVSCADPTNE